MATTTQLISPENAMQVAAKSVQYATAITIQNAEHYEMAAAVLQKIDDRLKQGDELFDPNIEAAHKSHKAAIAVKRAFTDPLEQAKKIIKSKMVSYSTEQERLRIEEERRLQEEARKEQEAKAAQEAAELEARGETHLADIVRQTATDALPVVVAPNNVPKVEGVSTLKVWDFVIEDETKIPREFLAVNESAIRAVVKAQKGLARIPGVKVFSKNDVRTTGRR
jgi:hypothetical protein